MKHPYYAEKVIRVYASCISEWIDEREVEMTNIEEDFEGRDILWFTCPHCGSEHKSLRRG